MKATLARLTAVVAVLLIVAPLEPKAQQAVKIATVGVLYPSAARTPIGDAFEQSLQDLGWVRNQNIRIEERFSAGQPDALDPLARELVALGVDVLVAWSPAGALAAKRSASQVPVVFLGAGEPVGLGLVSSLARPGGNVTGVSFGPSPEVYGKNLELLKEAVPALARVALLAPASESPRTTMDKQTMMAVAKALHLEVQEFEVQAPAELAAAVRRVKEQGAQALYVWPSGLAFAFRKQLSELALAHRLPSFHPFRESAIAGGLLSYGPSLTDIARRGAAYVDRILRGAKPDALPVENPTKFELVINLKTARALGLGIPTSLLVRADHVIE